MIHIQSLGLVFEAIPPLYNYQITITMSNLEWQNGKKTKSTKSQQKPEKFAVQEDFARVAKIFATLRKFRHAGNFRKVAKISQHCEISQSCENFATLRNFTKLRKFRRQKFRNVAKFPVCKNGRNFRRGCKIFATLAKMTASLFLASAASRLCSDDLLLALFLH